MTGTRVTVRDLLAGTTDLSRLDESHGGSLGGRDPGWLPERGWFQRDEPTWVEERAVDVRELGRAA